MVALGKGAPSVVGVWIESASQGALLQPPSSRGLETESRQHGKKRKKKDSCPRRVYRMTKPYFVAIKHWHSLGVAVPFSPSQTFPSLSWDGFWCSGGSRIRNSMTA